MADFKATVEGCGGTAAIWKQGKFLGNQTFGAGGVCGPLSAKWIKDRKLKLNFATDTNSEDGREEVMQLKINQKNTPNTYVEDYLKLVGLGKHFTQTYAGALSVSQLVTTATSGPGYYFVGVSTQGMPGVALSGHAFAVDMYDNKVFDSNVGQATFDSDAKLKQFFSLWFRLQYMDLQGSSYVERYF